MYNRTMTGKTFLQALSNSGHDVVQLLLDLLRETGAQYCLVGGLAVNAYAEPVVSLDLDLVVVAERLDELCAAAEQRGFQVEHFPHSVNLSVSNSDLRIQLQTDARYQQYLQRATQLNVLGYPLRVAAVEDVLQGKAWAYQDPSRRRSKRQKDLADIFRLVEAQPRLAVHLPRELQEQME
jgi:hypothetical protein